MTTMIERVARAIYEGRNGYGCKPWSRLTNAHREPYELDALNALHEIRTPTDAMVKAGIKREVGWEYGERGCPDDGPHVSSHASYTAMIDAALLEQQP